MATKRTNSIKLTGATPIELDASNAVTGTLADSGSTDILCDKRIPVDVDGVTYYIALYDTTA